MALPTLLPNSQAVSAAQILRMLMFLLAAAGGLSGRLGGVGVSFASPVSLLTSCLYLWA